MHKPLVLHAILNSLTRVLVHALATTAHALVKLARVVVFASPLTFILATHLWIEHAITMASHETCACHAAVTIMAGEFLDAVATTLHALALLARIEFHASLHALRSLFTSQRTSHALAVAHHEGFGVQAISTFTGMELNA
jgi:hypothetical protein